MYLCPETNQKNQIIKWKCCVCFTVTASYTYIMKNSVDISPIADRAQHWIGHAVLVEFFLLFIESQSAAGYFQYKYPPNSTWRTLWHHLHWALEAYVKHMAINDSRNVLWLLLSNAYVDWDTRHTVYLQENEVVYWRGLLIWTCFMNTMRTYGVDTQTHICTEGLWL